jgi:hypothetical protein
MKRCRAMGEEGRKEVEKWGWSAATKKIREVQYMQAKKKSQGKRRFGFLALRVGLGRFFRFLLHIITVVASWCVGRLDYARKFRTPAPC